MFEHSEAKKKGWRFFEGEVRIDNLYSVPYPHEHFSFKKMMQAP
jgi:hypothetical protein